VHRIHAQVQHNVPFPRLLVVLVLAGQRLTSTPQERKKETQSILSLTAFI